MRTGEAYLKVMNSHVVGIGGNSTGLNLFTLKLQQQQFWKVKEMVIMSFNNKVISVDGPYKNFSILFVFYTYFIAVLLLLKPYFTSSGLFYPCFIIPNHKIAHKIDDFYPILWKCCFVK